MTGRKEIDGTVLTSRSAGSQGMTVWQVTSGRKRKRRRRWRRLKPRRNAASQDAEGRASDQPAAGAAFKDALCMQWRTLWAGSPQRRKMAKIDAKLPSPAFLRATDDLTRVQVSVLIQLRTGHAPLNAFLHRIGKVDSPRYQACLGADKTVHHFLFDCPTHVHAQYALARKLGRLSKSVCHLLGNWRAF